MNRTTYLAGASLLALALTGCSDTNDFKPVTGMDGMDIYANACASCHGDGGKGARRTGANHHRPGRIGAAGHRRDRKSVV